MLWILQLLDFAKWDILSAQEYNQR
jgi:hypothetical protein